MNRNRLFLLDAYALIYRAYYALINAPRMSSKGFNTSAIYGFVNTLQDVLKRENPTHMAVCFDPPGPTFRHEAFEGYKAERPPTPEDIRLAIPYIKRILEAYRIPVIEKMGYEADDVIGTLAKQAQSKGFDAYMMTPDKDFGQVVDEHIFQYKPGKQGGDFEVLGVKEICDSYEFETPLQVIDYLALMGDKVDNIPGCPGVGKVTAIKLIKQFGSIESMLERTDELKGAMRTKVEENAEQIRFSKFLATIKIDVPIDLDEEALKVETPDYAALYEVFNELEFRTLITRIIGDKVKAAATPTPAPKVESMQCSLFDAEEENSEEEVVEVKIANINTEAHRYDIIDNPATVSKLAEKLSSVKEYGVHIVTSGESSIERRIVGVAISAMKSVAAYIPMPSDEEARRALISSMKPMFVNNLSTLVSADVKADILALANEGVQLSVEYFDVAVAHYLVQPEMSHDVARLASTMLGYDTIAWESLIKSEGTSRTKRTINEIPVEQLCDYACEQADMALRLKPLLLERIQELGMSELLRDVEFPLIEVLADMEMTGVRLNEAVLNDYKSVLEARVQALEKEIYEIAGTQFNISSPAQVGEILFDRLKIDDKVKKTKSGKYSTSEDVLQSLKAKNPIVNKILDVRGLRKLLSTYVEALPQLVNPRTGRIHTTYNQTVTATGRLSSTNPNMQNIPVRSDEGREIRRAFIPAEGNVFFSADYSQIELRLVADLSGDETMVNAFNEGADIHTLTAARIYHKQLDEVLPIERSKAKTANFGILYGISAFGLSQRLEIPRAEAKMLIDGYFEMFPKVREYMDLAIAKGKEQEYVTTQFGRRRMLPDINSRNAIVRGFSERNAINAPIQGTAADIIKIAMVHIFRRFKEENLRSKMIMQVHDELNFDVLPEELDRVSGIVLTEMRRAYSGRVEMIPSSGVAQNWLEAH
ncbi:MAG: DNA polymerase I [Muribaculaceae bacterium]|nr:DNA polymerase I [Muribaculaceae bacterium]